MRYVAHVAALVGLLAMGLALGDFASDPNVGGGVGLGLLFVLLLLALGQLYRPGGVASRDPAPRPVREPREPREPRVRRRRVKAERPAPEEAPEPRRGRPAQTGGVWSGGWDASEADEARERRRQERLRRKDRG